jgi:hypothetical protein
VASFIGGWRSTELPPPQECTLGAQKLSMQQYYIRKDIYFCETDSGVIFLDLNSRQYFGVPKNQVDQLAIAVHDWSPRAHHPNEHDEAVESSPHRVISDLLRKGVLTRSEERRRSDVSNANVNPSRAYHFVRNVRTHLHARHVLTMALCVLKIRCALKLSRLRGVIHRLQLPMLTVPTPRREELWELLDTFLFLRPWFYTTRDACLLDSLVLSHFLRSYGVAVTLSLGVHANPFRAHAWVQSGPVILNDTLENVSVYTPLLNVTTGETPLCSATLQ